VLTITVIWTSKVKFDFCFLDKNKCSWFSVPGDDGVFICVLTSTFTHFQEELVVWKVILDVGEKAMSEIVKSKSEIQQLSQQDAEESLTLRDMCCVRSLHWYVFFFFDFNRILLRYAIYHDLAAKFHYQARKRFNCCIYWFIERFFGESITGFDEGILNDDH
jgi:hypothetical protein